jgi:hypothetical protein
MEFPYVRLDIILIIDSQLAGRAHRRILCLCMLSKDSLCRWFVAPVEENTTLKRHMRGFAGLYVCLDRYRGHLVSEIGGGDA